MRALRRDRRRRGISRYVTVLRRSGAGRRRCRCLRGCLLGHHRRRPGRHAEEHRLRRRLRRHPCKRHRVRRRNAPSTHGHHARRDEACVLHRLLLTLQLLLLHLLQLLQQRRVDGGNLHELAVRQHHQLRHLRMRHRLWLLRKLLRWRRRRRRTLTWVGRRSNRRAAAGAARRLGSAKGAARRVMRRGGRARLLFARAARRCRGESTEEHVGGPGVRGRQTFVCARRQHRQARARLSRAGGAVLVRGVGRREQTRERTRAVQPRRRGAGGGNRGRRREGAFAAIRQ
mmetsp:Transcript_31769/g.98293  ORF Transcript_31769/g.98293 Transcript_31769/m.98293 type:complete len:286 (-) Transcript_31769:1429-2286(-)